MVISNLWQKYTLLFLDPNRDGTVAENEKDKVRAAMDQASQGFFFSEDLLDCPQGIGGVRCEKVNDYYSAFFSRKERLQELRSLLASAGPVTYFKGYDVNGDAQIETALGAQGKRVELPAFERIGWIEKLELLASDRDHDGIVSLEESLRYFAMLNLPEEEWSSVHAIPSLNATEELEFNVIFSKRVIGMIGNSLAPVSSYMDLYDWSETALDQLCERAEVKIVVRQGQQYFVDTTTDAPLPFHETMMKLVFYATSERKAVPAAQIKPVWQDYRSKGLFPVSRFLEQDQVFLVLYQPVTGRLVSVPYPF